MSEQSEDSTNNSEPPPISLEILLQGPVSVPRTLGRNDDGTYGIYAPGLRDSLELPKYQPPNPLGVRRLSRATAAVAAPGEELDPEVPNLNSMEAMIAAEDQENLNVPLTTMLREGGAYSRRRDGPSHDLDVIQPCPSLTAGRKRARCPSPTLGPMPERLLKKVAREFSLSGTPDDIPVAACAPLDEDVKAEEASAGDVKAEEASAGDVKAEEASAGDVKAEEASAGDVKAEEASAGDVNVAAAKDEVRARVLGRIGAWVSNVGKGKAVLAQEAGGATQLEDTAEAEGEDNGWQLVEVGESWNGKEDMP